MAKEPSYNGIGSLRRPVIRITPKEEENKITTNSPKPATPSPRGHA